MPWLVVLISIAAPASAFARSSHGTTWIGPPSSRASVSRARARAVDQADLARALVDQLTSIARAPPPAPITTIGPASARHSGFASRMLCD